VKQTSQLGIEDKEVQNILIEKKECLVSALVTVYSAPPKLNEANKLMEEKTCY
jgi:hypothetical protein